MKKLICIGEALIDFIPLTKGLSLKDTPEFKKACGGAPTNVCAVAAKLNEEAIILTKLGKDSFGDYIIECLNAVNVNTKYIKQDQNKKTSLAFAALDKDGDRSFAFYRNEAADLDYSFTDLPLEIFDQDTILHFCSVDLVPSKMKEAHLRAIQEIKNKHGLVSFDPNLRLMLWDDKELLKNTVLEFLNYADIVKISDDELEFLFNTTNLEIVKTILFEKGIKWFIYSKGKDGVILMTKDKTIQVNGYKVNAVDTTGAGDSLIGVILTMLIKKNINANLENLSDVDYYEILDFANLYAAHTTTLKGAIPALATLEMLTKFKENL